MEILVAYAIVIAPWVLAMLLDYSLNLKNLKREGWSDSDKEKMSDCEKCFRIGKGCLTASSDEQCPYGH